jgi:hypothetical protein
LSYNPKTFLNLSLNSSKHITKALYGLLSSRGFENPSLVLNWEKLHHQCSNFFPTRLSSSSPQHQILYVMPNNKIASISFPYCKKEILEALWQQGYYSIKDICLTKSQ